jgi:hypothetical protein
MLKSQPDTIWHASALEAQCIIEVLNAWSAADGLVRLRILALNLAPQD